MNDMYRIYAIDTAIASILETAVTDEGELDEQAFSKIEGLQIDQAQLMDDLVCEYKNTCAVTEEIYKEVEKLRARKACLDRKAERIKDFVQARLQGQKMQTARNQISYRKSDRVDITNETAIPGEYLKPQPAKIDKAKIKLAIKAGKEVTGAELVSYTNMIIK